MTVQADTSTTSTDASDPQGGDAGAADGTTGADPQGGDGATTTTTTDDENGRTGTTPQGGDDRVGRLEAEVRRLRDENAERRVAARDAEQNVVQQIVAALTGGTDTGDEPPTVESLTATLTEQQAATETAEARATAAERNLAVYLNAPAGVDAGRLLKFTDFLSAIESLDPGDTEKLKQAIEDTVADNPWLRTQAVQATSTDTAGGSGEGAVSAEQFEAMTNAEKNELYRRDPDTYRRLAGAPARP